MPGLQGSLHATGRLLAPSKEALDAPLSPPPLNDEPGPATGHSGVYPDGTSTRRPGPASRTQHEPILSDATFVPSSCYSDGTTLPSLSRGTSFRSSSPAAAG